MLVKLDGVAELIAFEDFKKLDLRVGTIVSADKMPRTERLYKIQVDLGELGRKQTVSSLVGYYTPEELVGKRVVFFANLESTRFSGEISEGMLLAAEKGEHLALLTTDLEMENGARIT
ncbi:MAG: hypothetical protein V1857_04190 [archaeon]